jgi:hypothetical protein
MSGGAVALCTSLVALCADSAAGPAGPGAAAASELFIEPLVEAHGGLFIEPFFPPRTTLAALRAGVPNLLPGLEKKVLAENMCNL